ncbi:MAG TPA: M24 family metallopeptidase [Steroidobacteraceae bacterium]|nr:M24 family metallopeptidase [Steroidobacteraceae bacterium]
MSFQPEEYRDRWARVWKAMQVKGYEWLLVWQRGGGAYDRLGDVYWLTHFVMNGSGQDPASEEFGAPYTFSAVLIRQGGEPELHVGLPEAELDLTGVVCGRVVSHAQNLSFGLAQHLASLGVEGRVALIGDDLLPGMYDRQLRSATPQITWCSEETLLLEPQRVKSAAELEVFRRAGALVTEALTELVAALRSGTSSAEAASRAAAAIVRGGGGYHRIDTHHGPGTERTIISQSLYGYDTTVPRTGDLARAWIFGPILDGYWLDPGRSFTCGAPPTAAQRGLLEAAVEVVDGIVQAMKPGVTPRQLGILGGELARRHGYFDYPQLRLPLLGHGLSTNFIPYVIPLGEGDPDPTGILQYDVPLEAGMVMASELFLTHPGVGTVGFEQNAIVTADGHELLTRTPMLYA